MREGVYGRSLPPPCPRGGSHPSSPDIAIGIKRPTRRQAGRLCLPIRPCTGWGLPCSRCLHRDGELLPRHFNLAPTSRGGIFSVALSVGSPRPAVSRHPARWCSDFPPSRHSRDGGRPSTSHTNDTGPDSQKAPRVRREQLFHARGVTSISLAPTSALAIICLNARRASSISSPAALRISSSLSEGNSAASEPPGPAG